MALSKVASQDFSRYSKYLKAIGALTELFSDSDRPLIHSRTAERLFVFLTGARDLSRRDNSFDAALGTAGVGVKTFTTSSIDSASSQKIAEFSNATDRNRLSGLSPKLLAKEISERRNLRLSSDATQYGISLDASYYHCLVRIPGGVVICEIPMKLVQTEHLKPLDSKGRVLKVWPKTVRQNTSVFFTDGLHVYSYHPGKSVLMMRFDLKMGAMSPQIKIVPIQNVFAYLLTLTHPKRTWKSEESGIWPAGRKRLSLPTAPQESVVLPLYSWKSGEVPLLSGLNQWRARGRRRSFGEAYIQIPRIVHDLSPGFFPMRDQNFTLALPDASRISVKVCQAGEKALMSKPNSLLGAFLLKSLDGDLESAKSRFFDGRAYRREDLNKLGSDSLRISKTSDSSVYQAEFAPIGAFESYLENLQDQLD